MGDVNFEPINNEIKNGAKLTGSVGGDPLKKEKKQDFKNKK